MGGMGIRNPVEMANIAYITSDKAYLRCYQRKKSPFHTHNAKVVEAISTVHHDLQQQDQNKLDSVLSTLDAKQVGAIQRAITLKTSSWLTVLPTTYHHFDFSATEFRDALTVRYHRPLLKMPVTCDGCGATFIYEHALDCKKGSLITGHHNKVRDTLGDLSSIVYKDIIREPVIQEACEVADEPSLVADLGVRGVWQPQPQTQALFDVRVIDTDAPSHVNRRVAAILSSAEAEKKKKCNNAANARRASFTPFVVSVGGALGHEATYYPLNTFALNGESLMGMAEG